MTAPILRKVIKPPRDTGVFCALCDKYDGAAKSHTTPHCKRWTGTGKDHPERRRCTASKNSTFMETKIASNPWWLSSLSSMLLLRRQLLTFPRRKKEEQEQQPLLLLRLIWLWLNCFVWPQQQTEEQCFFLLGYLFVHRWEHSNLS